MILPGGAGSSRGNSGDEATNPTLVMVVPWRGRKPSQWLHGSMSHSHRGPASLLSVVPRTGNVRPEDKLSILPFQISPSQP